MTTEKQIPTLEEVAEQLKNKPETLALGKVWYVKALLALIDEINTKLVQNGESTWRLPTRAELRASHQAKDGRFGNWFTWSGDIDHTVPDCLYIINMRDSDHFGDTDGSQVEAYLIKA